jgi:hypothetical protein
MVPSEDGKEILFGPGEFARMVGGGIDPESTLRAQCERLGIETRTSFEQVNLLTGPDLARVAANYLREKAEGRAVWDAHQAALAEHKERKRAEREEAARKKQAEREALARVENEIAKRAEAKQQAEALARFKEEQARARDLDDAPTMEQIAERLRREGALA